MLTDDSDSRYVQGRERTSSIGSSILLRAQSNDQTAWEELVDYYYPKIYSWCRRSGLESHAARDVCQDVFRSMLSGFYRFRRSADGDSLGAWLRVITKRRLADFFAGQPDPALSLMSEPQWPEKESSVGPGDPLVSEVVQAALVHVQAEFETSTWQAFWMTTIENRCAQEVADLLQLSRNAVYLAKSRVTKRLREFFKDLDEKNQ